MYYIKNTYAFAPLILKFVVEADGTWGLVYILDIIHERKAVIWLIIYKKKYIGLTLIDCNFFY